MKHYKKRLDRWKKSISVPAMLDTRNDKKFLALMKERNIRDYIENDEFSFYDVIRGSKELIFTYKNLSPNFISINYTIDTLKFELKIGEGWRTINNGEDSEEEDEFAVRILAQASMCDVPIYPNTKKDEVFLAKYYEELLLNGFITKDEEGKRIRIVNSYSPKEGIKDLSYLLNRDSTIGINPAELALVKIAAKSSLAKLSRAHEVINSLESAISEFSALISSKKRNELMIQKCISKNPILFGLDYVRVLPEHRLGSEYIADYALEKFSGNFDVVELESSNLNLYNKNGDPSRYLVHAEQQVLDWLEWLEKFSPYANNSLPGITSPAGFVIIGRSNKLSVKQKRKLERRNKTFGDRLKIFTYDDLLAKANNTLNLLST